MNIMIYLESKKYKIMLLQFTLKNRRIRKMCYSPEPGPYGWCGTCYNGELTPGKEGYCDYFTGIKISYFDFCLFINNLSFYFE